MAAPITADDTRDWSLTCPTAGISLRLRVLQGRCTINGCVSFHLRPTTPLSVLWEDETELNFESWDATAGTIQWRMSGIVGYDAAKLGLGPGMAVYWTLPLPQLSSVQMPQPLCDSVDAALESEAQAEDGEIRTCGEEASAHRKMAVTTESARAQMSSVPVRPAPSLPAPPMPPPPPPPPQCCRDSQLTNGSDYAVECAAPTISTGRRKREEAEPEGRQSGQSDEDASHPKKLKFPRESSMAFPREPITAFLHKLAATNSPDSRPLQRVRSQSPPTSRPTGQRFLREPVDRELQTNNVVESNAAEDMVADEQDTATSNSLAAFATPDKAPAGREASATPATPTDVAPYTVEASAEDGASMIHVRVIVMRCIQQNGGAVKVGKLLMCLARELPSSQKGITCRWQALLDWLSESSQQACFDIAGSSMEGIVTTRHTSDSEHHAVSVHTSVPKAPPSGVVEGLGQPEPDAPSMSPEQSVSPALVIDVKENDDPGPAVGDGTGVAWADVERRLSWEANGEQHWPPSRAALDDDTLLSITAEEVTELTTPGMAVRADTHTSGWRLDRNMHRDARGRMGDVKLKHRDCSASINGVSPVASAVDAKPIASGVSPHQACEGARCRFLRVENLPYDCTTEELRAMLLPSGTVEEVHLTFSEGPDRLRATGLVAMRCTREATAARRLFDGQRLRGSTLAAVFDPARLPPVEPLPVLPKGSGAASDELAAPHVCAEMDAPPSTEAAPPPPAPAPDPHCLPSSLAGYEWGYQSGYHDGRADVAREIQADAAGQVEGLLLQLKEERQRELDGAMAAQYERLRHELLDDAGRAAQPTRAAGVEMGVVRAGTGRGDGDGGFMPVAAAMVATHSEERLIRRQLALRQFVEMRRAMLGKATAKPWRLAIRRPQLMSDVLESFSAVSAKKRALLFSPTSVTFHNAWGEAEDGHDQGGLTAEMYTLFWASLRRSRLFCGERLLLPSPVAHGSRQQLVELEAVGLAFCKCILDDQPIGFGFAPFLFEWLVYGDESEALREPAAALRALADLDPELSASWTILLQEPSLVDSLELELQSFALSDDQRGVAGGPPTSEMGTERVTSATLERAVVAGCRHRLLDVRREACDALRRGFMRCEDLTVQLAAFELGELLSFAQGQADLNADELLSCFALPSSSQEEAIAAGFDEAGARVADDFEELLRDGLLLDGAQRIALLRWCTSLTVLPLGGLREHKIRLRLYGPEPDDCSLPETHTCTRELHLPNYSGPSVLCTKLLLALEHADDGFHKE